ncbi:MAG: hypothetical protein HF978_21135 [Desulfobacteraceae bacterium]|nr:hypothetical protein [Desulfobacteraceae bacterium]MBC2758055.1 hypothetical protein [Desulfobacteraceae bacterium]
MHIYVGYFTYFLSESYLESGNIKHARDSIEETLTLSRKIDSKYIEAKSLILKGRISGKMTPSEMDTAENNILDGLESLETMKLKPDTAQGYLYLGELYADNGQKEKAFENLTKAEGMFKEMEMDYWLERTKKILVRL